MTVTPADPAPTTTALTFGLVFNINGTSVPISTNDLTQIATNGIAFKLPEPLDLGSVSDFFGFLSSSFGVGKPDTSTWPGPLPDVVSKVEALLDVEVTIQQLYVKVPGKGSTLPIQYDVGVGLTWADGGISLVDGLAIEGAVFGATNMPPVAPKPPQ